MHGLPPPPADVARITAYLDVNGEVVTTGWWVFAPGVDVATPPQINSLLGDWFVHPIAELLPLLSHDTSVSLLQCETFGVNALSMSLQPSPNAGALDGSTALNACVVWTWLTATRRNGSRTHNWLPLSRSNLGSDKRRLSGLGFAEAGSRALHFLDQVSAVASPDGATCVLAALHRSSGGVPLSSSQLLPIQSAKASPIVGTLQRRTGTAPRAPSTL